MLCVYLEQTTGKVMAANGDKPELSKEDIKIMLDFYKRMYDGKVIMPIEKSTVNSFKTQKTAGVVRWVSGAEEYFEDAADEDIEVIVGPYPQNTDGVKQCWYVKPATLYAISKTTDNPHEAGRLVDYLLNSEKMTVLQGTEKGIPISKSALDILKSKKMIPKLEGDANQLIIDNRSYLEVMNPLLENESAYRLFKQESDFYIYNKSSLDEVADKIYNGFNS